MAKILVIYATDYGNTEKMAQEIRSGAATIPDTEVTLRKAEEVEADDLRFSDAVLVGTPVHMGCCDWRIKKFIDTLCGGMWLRDELVGKVGGVFATGSGYGGAGGGCELTMLSLLTNLAELGMILVPLPRRTPGYSLGGLQWGPYARSAGVNMEQDGVRAESLEAAWHHGANVARLAELVRGNRIFD